MVITVLLGDIITARHIPGGRPRLAADCGPLKGNTEDDIVCRLLVFVETPQVPLRQETPARVWPFLRGFGHGTRRRCRFWVEDTSRSPAVFFF